MVDGPRYYSGRARRSYHMLRGAEQSHVHGDPHPPGPPVPQVAGGSIAFSVRVPARIQEDLQRPLPTENFEVDIRMEAGFPVAFVRAVGNERFPQRYSAWSVYIVREFLQREFEHRKEELGGVTFCFIGPSPMWAHCSLITADQDPELLSFERVVNSLGYDDLIISCSNRRLADAAAAYKSIKDLAVQDLGLYYELCNEENGLQVAWNEIELARALLLDTFYATGIRAPIRRTFRMGRESRRLSLRVVEIEAELASVASWADREVKQLDAASSTYVPFRSFLNERIAEVKALTPPGIAETASLLDKLHDRTVQTSTLLLSSVLGGAVGAAITAVIGGGRPG